MNPLIQDSTAVATEAQTQPASPLISSTSFVEGLAESLGLPPVLTSIVVKMITILIIFLIALVIIKFVDRAVRLWLKRYESSPTTDPFRQRAATLGDLFRSAIRYTIWPMALIIVLSEMGLDVAALIATAGIGGLAIGFGAQTLVKDVISGIFLLFDDSIHVGDLIRIDGDTGTVEFIGVRLIKVRKFSGELLMVPAGELRIFGNNSIGFARAIVTIGLAYEQNIEEILPAVKEIADKWHEENKGVMLEDEPVIHSITELGASQVSIRVAAQVIPGEQFDLERKLRRAIKNEFDDRGIEIPFPRQTIYLRQDAEDKAK